ncbi:MAG: cyclase [Ruminococcaceae bacterium]|nr:cyclase [Oscillospiraceae bacterium]
MKIYDISQEVFSCVVFPGDPAPKKETLNSMDNGDLYNLTSFSMCAHNGTHIDAPSHFMDDGANIDSIPLSKTVGYAYVAEHNGTINASDIKSILEKAEGIYPEAAKRILINGRATLSFEAAEVIAASDVVLFGNESQTVGPEDAPMAVHKLLLGKKIVLLEGIRLGGVEEGVYLLNAAPLNLGGCEGAPCRAILIDLK